MRVDLGEVAAELLHEGEEHALAEGERLLVEQLRRIQLLAQPCHPVHICHVQHPPKRLLIPAPHTPASMLAPQVPPSLRPTPRLAV